MLFAVGGLALLLAAYAHWRFGQFDEKIGRVRTQVVELRAAQDRLDSQIGMLATQLQQSNDQVRAQIRSLREVPTQVGELGQSVAELRARTDAPQRTWVRAEALYLLELGARRLQLEHDVPTAIAALESADARLATVPDPAVTEVRAQLARELAALRAVDVPDVSAVLAQLAAIEAGASGLRVLGVPVALARGLDDPAGADAGESRFDRAMRRLRESWRDLFSYRRVDPARSRLVTHEEEALRRQQFELQLFAARISAMQQDRAGYAQALQASIALLDGLFDTRDEAVLDARAAVAQLATVDVDPAVPEVGSAAQLLRKVIRGQLARSDVMRGSLLTASALVGGGLLAHLVLDDPGYVAISAGRSLFETTVPVFLLLLLGLYFLARALLGSLTARRRLATLRAERRRRRARDDTQRGLLDLAAGRWRSAEDLLSRAASESDSAAVNYLVAARAADLQDAVDRRDEWLARAQDAAPDERAAALITLAEMQMRRGQDAAAVQTLEQLDASGDLNSRGLELLARLYQKLGRGEQLRTLGPRLRAAKELPESQVNEILAQVQLEEVRAAGERRDVPAANEAWSKLPRATRRLPQAVAAYARALVAAGDATAAEKLLREAIDDRLEPALVRLYGELVLPDPLAPLERAESWLRKSPQDPDLLAACARLALQAELIGKARSYLEASLARKPNAESSLLYAELLEQLGEGERARTVLRDSVARTVGRRPALPRVRLRRR